ncbi:MAG: hypothetical protein M1820_005609 [Bogoriella megaspora]|nr:MAG: hypothetical protein M1820_005609 [Bogoriella megaspora]
MASQPSISGQDSLVEPQPAPNLAPFFEPGYPGEDTSTCPSYSFLITHPSNNRKVLFDLGTPKAWEYLSPPIKSLLQSDIFTFNVEKDVATILQDHSIDLKEIEAIIWSHHHWDHIGDPSLFPSSTSLIVGSGFKSAYLPPYPSNPESPLRESDFAGRELHEVPFNSDLKIGRFKAHDYFGDGSFYLLDTPGHTTGHICGLARTTVNPSSFILMAGDACHLGAEMRPSAWRPIPRNISPSPLPSFPTPCPGHLLTSIHRSASHSSTQESHQRCATCPFVVPTQKINQDPKKAEWTIEGLQEFDADENVMVALAHDERMMEVVDFFPKRMDAWKEKGWGEELRWRFLGDFEAAVKQLA